MAGRTEARIFASIWNDEHFITLPSGAQRLYMFLISQKDLTYCGVMPLRQSNWARKAPDTTVADIELHLKWLEGTGYPSPYPDPESAPTPLVVVDHDTDELLVRSLLRVDGIWKQPNLLKLAREAAGSVDSRRICGAMLSELKRLPLEETGSSQVKTQVTDFIADLEKGGPYPTPYPPPMPPDDPSDDPTEKDYARAQGTGERYVAVPGIPVPPYPDAPLTLPPQSRKNATRLPDTFVLTAEMLTWAAKHAPNVSPEREFERFRDYWLAKPGRDGRKLDWLATWRNWMRNAQDRQGPRDRSSRQESEQAQLERAMQRANARGGQS